MQHVVCHVVRRTNSAIKLDRVEIAFILALCYWLKPLTDDGEEEVTGMTRPGKMPTWKAGIEPGSPAVGTDTLSTRPTRWSTGGGAMMHTAVHHPVWAGTPAHFALILSSFGHVNTISISQPAQTFVACSPASASLAEYDSVTRNTDILG